MRILNINVNDLTLSKAGNYDNVVRGTDNYLCLWFHFDNSWKNRKRVAHIEDVEQNSYNCIVGADNKVKLPKEVTGTSRIFVKLYGKEGSVTVSTNTVVIEQE